MVDFCIKFMPNTMSFILIVWIISACTAKIYNYTLVKVTPQEAMLFMDKQRMAQELLK